MDGSIDLLVEVLLLLLLLVLAETFSVHVGIVVDDVRLLSIILYYVSNHIVVRVLSHFIRFNIVKYIRIINIYSL